MGILKQIRERPLRATVLAIAGVILTYVIEIPLRLVEHWAFGSINEWIGKEVEVLGPRLTDVIAVLVRWAIPLFLAVAIIWTTYRLARTRDRSGRRSVTNMAWRERDRLELYMIACLSLGYEPRLPIEEEPENTRLRLLKDAIRFEGLPAVLSSTSPDEPNVWATVARDDLKAFAERKGHASLLKFIEQWTGTNSPDPATVRRIVRLRLAELRTEGVALRNAGLVLRDEVSVHVWTTQTDIWDRQVRDEIKKIDPADAEWFRTLDVFPQPRLVSAEYINVDHWQAHAEHDFRLRRLDDLIQRYSRSP